MLRPLQNNFNPADFPALLVGLREPDDAAVYRVNDQQAIIATVDFFPPVVDDPYAFGAIAAANAMSDVYAMGGEVLFATNLVAFPDNLDLAILTDILRGGADSIQRGGAVIAGGHTVKDKEPKYGLAVTGLAHPDRLLMKGGARSADVLYLTKPLGTGVITTAHKHGQVDQADLRVAIDSMIVLNRTASQIAAAVGVRGATDVTGYSLLGHAHEMAHLANVDFVINYGSLPWLTNAQHYAEAGHFPGGAANNLDYYQPWVSFEGEFSDTTKLLLFDPQTSGGLLLAVPAAQTDRFEAECHAHRQSFWQIGQVINGTGRLIVR